MLRDEGTFYCFLAWRAEVGHPKWLDATDWCVRDYLLVSPVTRCISCFSIVERIRIFKILRFSKAAWRWAHVVIEGASVYSWLLCEAFGHTIFLSQLIPSSLGQSRIQAGSYINVWHYVWSSLFPCSHPSKYGWGVCLIWESMVDVVCASTWPRF